MLWKLLLTGNFTLLGFLTMYLLVLKLWDVMKMPTVMSRKIVCTVAAVAVTSKTLHDMKW